MPGAGRERVVTTYAVASAHPLSTAAGLEVLRRGGNAYDAVLAVSATLPVVQPHTNGLGSDFFAVVRDHRSTAINSSGPAGRNVDVAAFRTRGLRRIPARGPLSAITVPGLVGAWRLLGRKLRLRWKDDLAPAIRIASEGFPASPSLARACRSIGWGDRDFRSTFGGVRAGTRFRQLALASTLSEVAADEGYGFYHGHLAQEICRDLRAKGGLLEPRDFDSFSPCVETPLRVRYRSYFVETNPPPSQGATALIWMNLLARRALRSLSEREFVATLVRTMPTAYQYRAKYIGDPSVVSFPPQLLRPSALYPPQDTMPSGPRGSTDTTAFSVYDGRVGVSAIQSNYSGFGSGVAIRGTGITLNNRGSYFTLEPGHHNVVAPGKRTFHTLMATVASGPRMVLLGSMGADAQPQVVVQILTRHLDRGQPLAEAIAAPRFVSPAQIYGPAPLYREPGLPLARGKVLRGHPSAFGHAQGISVGVRIEVGVDPRGDGLLPLPS